MSMLLILLDAWKAVIWLPGLSKAISVPSLKVTVFIVIVHNYLFALACRSRVCLRIFQGEGNDLRSALAYIILQGQPRFHPQYRHDLLVCLKAYGTSTHPYPSTAPTHRCKPGFRFAIVVMYEIKFRGHPRCS